ncbi:hypothetical protein Slin15195_G083490 [Septoria linicola]|uniref:Uncharacterized protein n=1 Tax=Septoria linicola TaxID=215465 RepID=A0A9Q9AYU7_9PEZI|nr:hypothetical protein Slin14017_G086000 [Septoria linicola]USW55030.1 hypothetical protein Slin15195_G083490 [Septoria linicola]
MERRDSTLDVVVRLKTEQPPSPETHDPQQDLASKLDQQEQPSSSSSPPPTSLLDRLPDELLLIVWEYAVISPTPLHINCPCDSSFGGWNEAYYAEREAWEEGERSPPWQPSLTRVCRSIRADTLPMFYKYNDFRAGYCYECDTDIVMDWLRVIGKENRETMQAFFFWDENPEHDRYSPKCLKKLRRSAAVRELGGHLESTYTAQACRHDVTFGEEAGYQLDGIVRLFEDAL